MGGKISDWREEWKISRAAVDAVLRLLSTGPYRPDFSAPPATAGVTLPLSACGSDGEPTAPVDVMTGTYTLVSLNGAPIPALWGVFNEDDQDFDVYVTTTSLEARPDRTVSFSAFLEFRLGGTGEGRILTLQVPPDNTIPASVWVYER